MDIGSSWKWKAFLIPPYFCWTGRTVFQGTNFCPAARSVFLRPHWAMMREFLTSSVLFDNFSFWLNATNGFLTMTTFWRYNFLRQLKNFSCKGILFAAATHINRRSSAPRPSSRISPSSEPVMQIWWPSVMFEDGRHECMSWIRYTSFSMSWLYAYRHLRRLLHPGQTGLRRFYEQYDRGAHGLSFARIFADRATHDLLLFHAVLIGFFSCGDFQPKMRLLSRPSGTATFDSRAFLWSLRQRMISACLIAAHLSAASTRRERIS